MNIIIGVDHGNGLMKTAHSTFKTGVTEFTGGIPFGTDKVVRIDNKFYVVDGNSRELREDKTEDETYWHLTLAAIGEELKVRNIAASNFDKPTNIVLAVGMPISRFFNKSVTAAFKKWFRRSRVDFWYGGQHYFVNIDLVYAYPQGYSAAMTVFDKIKNQFKANIVDIGSRTVDILQFDNGNPDFKKIDGASGGCGTLIKDAIEQVRRKTGLDIVQEQVEEVIWGDPDYEMPADVKPEILDSAEKYADNLVRAITAKDFDTKTLPTFFTGGGATVVKRFYKGTLLYKPFYITDVRTNAIGYEGLAAKAHQNG